jgi:L-alanine-DL-glutamate epimerase-like enolase superfamily enzyme
MPTRSEIRQLRLKELRIPFKAAFRHASAERAGTSSVWVEAVSRADNVGYGESCPRPYVTGESIASARTFTARHEAALCDEIVDLASLRTWMASHADELDANPAAWCAVEIAILDLLAQESGQTIEAFLSLPPMEGRFRYTAVLGDAETEAYERTFEQYRRMGFTDFKIKLSGNRDRDRAKMAVFRGSDGEAARVRVDANNLWERADDAIHFLQDLACRFFAVEEPIRPHQYGELARIADALNCQVVLDESFVRIGQFAQLGGTPARWLINLRVSKMGGLLRSLQVVEAARAAGIGLIVGAQVGETSLLTRAALTVAHAGRDGLVAQEGAFGTFLLSEDVCDPPLMFGAGGLLDISSDSFLHRPGLGVVNPARLDSRILRSLDP